MHGVSYITYAFIVIAALIVTLVWLRFFSTLASPIVGAEVKSSANFIALQLATYINSLVPAREGQEFTTTLPKTNCSIYIDEYDVSVKAKDKTATIPHLVFPVEAYSLQCSSEREVRVRLIREKDKIVVIGD